MSRAFVNEDGPPDPEPTFDLPEPESPEYPAAAARALLEGANAGNSPAAELATGYRWGARELVGPMRIILEKAEAGGEERLAQLARRFLREAV